MSSICPKCNKPFNRKCDLTKHLKNIKPCNLPEGKTVEELIEEKATARAKLLLERSDNLEDEKIKSSDDLPIVNPVAGDKYYNLSQIANCTIINEDNLDLTKVPEGKRIVYTVMVKPRGKKENRVSVSLEDIETKIKPKVNSRNKAKSKEQNKDDIILEIDESIKDDPNAIAMRLINKLHNMIYSEGISGMDAFYDINKLLFIRFIQQMIIPGGRLESLIDQKSYLLKDKKETISLDDNNNPIYDEHDPSFILYEIEDANGEPLYIEGFLPNNLKYLKLSNLLKEEEGIAFKTALFKVWDILSLHPLTENIFQKNKAFNASPNMIRLLLIEIDKAFKNIHFDEFTNDIKGQIYEYFLNGYSGRNGKAFGQFFTPRNLINCIMKLSSELFPDFKTTNIYDPCMGTGGFLIDRYKHCAKHENNKISSKNIVGCEIVSNTFATGLMNILLTTGDIGNIKFGNSLIDNKDTKYSRIDTNPPFKITFKYVDILKHGLFKGSNSVNMKELYPIETNNGGGLFLQHCIYKLKNEGVCNIILPNGELLDSDKFINLRKYLIEECDLIAIVYIPSKTFLHTDIQTCCFIFTKHADTCTSEVKFYQIEEGCNNYKLLGIVDIEQIKEKKYNLQYKRYETKIKISIDNSIVIKTLGEICEIKKGKFSSNQQIKKGKYPFYSGKAINPSGYLDEYCFDYIKYILIITGGGSLGKNENDNVGLGKVFLVSDKSAGMSAVSSLCVIDKTISVDYIYYYLKTHKKEITDLSIASTRLGVIKQEDLLNFQIPIPSSEVQQQIISDCELFEKRKSNIIECIILLEKEAEFYRRKYIEPLFNDENSEIKTLNDLCEINQGKLLKKENIIYGEYPVIGGGKIMGYHNCFNIDNDSFVLTRVGDPNINWFDTNYYLTDNGFALTKKTNTENKLKYIYYYILSNIEIIETLYAGIAQKVISKTKLQAIEIPIPSLEKQQSIINKYDSLYKKINECNEELKLYESNIKIIFENL